ncbi:hypothetical protein JCM8547_004634 [Rhodosporidiobolus lusitaniae]
MQCIEAIQGSGFRPRQSSYLRISPTTVLQMILYLEPAHTEWMSNNVLERMLFALKDRIPLKLAQEGEGKKSGKEKTQVDVFRGADYQMAFFFRRSNDKHVVLLKDKQLHYASKPSQKPHMPPPPPPTASRGRKRARSPSSSATPAPPPPPPAALGSVDLTGAGEPASKRRAAGEGEEEVEDDDDDIVVVKPEPVDNELPPEGALFRPDDDKGGVRGEEEVKMEDEIDEDVKPQLKVNYQGYRIFGRTLVVIVEPYPPLAPEDLARPRLLQQEIRQLSASVAPDSYRRSVSTYRGSTLSATPAPLASRNNPLFRERSETQTPAPDLEGTREEEDGQMQQLRERTEDFANEWDEEHEGEGRDGEEDDELPSLNVALAKERRATVGVEGEGEGDEHA